MQALPPGEVTFDYGGVFVRYAQQTSDGSMMPSKHTGWNKTTNKKQDDITPINWPS